MRATPELHTITYFNATGEELGLFLSCVSLNSRDFMDLIWTKNLRGSVSTRNVIAWVNGVILSLVVLVSFGACGHFKDVTTDITPYLDFSEKSKVYQLRPGDIVQVEVFQEPVMTARQRILGNGAITVGLIGTVNVLGLNVEEAAAKIAALLNEKQLVNPQVTISVLAYAPRRFTVMGSVKGVASYNIPPEEVLFLPEALAMAGGNTIIGNPERIVVTRKVGDQINHIRVNLFDAKTQFFKIEEGDLIFVPETVF